MLARLTWFLLWSVALAVALAGCPSQPTSLDEQTPATNDDTMET